MSTKYNLVDKLKQVNRKLTLGMKKSTVIPNLKKKKLEKIRKNEEQ